MGNLADLKPKTDPFYELTLPFQAESEYLFLKSPEKSLFCPFHLWQPVRR